MRPGFISMTTEVSKKEPISFQDYEQLVHTQQGVDMLNGLAIQTFAIFDWKIQSGYLKQASHAHVFKNISDVMTSPYPTNRQETNRLILLISSIVNGLYECFFKNMGPKNTHIYMQLFGIHYPAMWDQLIHILDFKSSSIQVRSRTLLGRDLSGINPYVPLIVLVTHFSHLIKHALNVMFLNEILRANKNSYIFTNNALPIGDSFRSIYRLVAITAHVGSIATFLFTEQKIDQVEGHGASYTPKDALQSMKIIEVGIGALSLVFPELDENRKHLQTMRHRANWIFLPIVIKKALQPNGKYLWAKKASGLLQVISKLNKQYLWINYLMRNYPSGFMGYRKDIPEWNINLKKILTPFKFLEPTILYLEAGIDGINKVHLGSQIIVVALKTASVWFNIKALHVTRAVFKIIPLCYRHYLKFSK
jgi:hypothetical protein